MGKKLYVGNMNYDMGNTELEEMFGAHGTVESVQVRFLDMASRLLSL